MLKMFKFSLRLLSCASLLLSGIVPSAFSQPAPSSAAPSQPADRTALALEALSRLEGVDLEQNPKVKAAVFKILGTTRGSPAFVKIVEQFKLAGQTDGLLEVAQNYPAHESGVAALRLVLGQGDLQAVRAIVSGTNETAAARLLEALGNTREQVAVPLIAAVLTNSTAGPVLRNRSVIALAQTLEGARLLLRFLREQKLEDPLPLSAGLELSRSRWDEIKQEAAVVAPLPQMQNAEALPSLAVLSQRKGDARKGEATFNSPTAGCAKCHQVAGRGVEVGPNLSEIGSKLGKDALYEAILNPSAGISFGFENWRIELQNGEELDGLIANETPEELAIKDTNGVVTRVNKRTIQARTQSKLSLMPSGLQQIMTVQDLVDLIEYLASLKKAEAR